MTPERLAQIRILAADKEAPFFAKQLLAEVDRLEETLRVACLRLSGASMVLHYGQHVGAHAACPLESCRLDREVFRSLDSPPAKR